MFDHGVSNMCLTGASDMEKAGESGGSEKSCQALKNIPKSTPVSDVAIAKMIG